MLDEVLRYWLIFTAGPSFLIAGLAMFHRRWITAVMVVMGGFIGMWAAVVPLFRSMARYEAETGYGGGNAGVLLCCTVPLFPVAGMVLLGLIGLGFDNWFRAGLHADTGEGG